MTAAWYSATALATRRPERLRTAARQPCRPARLDSSGTSLGTIHPAAAKPGSCEATMRCSRRRCQITTATSPRNTGTMTKP